METRLKLQNQPHWYWVRFFFVDYRYILPSLFEKPSGNELWQTEPKNTSETKFQRQFLYGIEWSKCREVQILFTIYLATENK